MKLRSQPSSIENQASLWLVTCSDLFFLIFGFFVLNHTLTDEQEKGTFQIEESLPSLRNNLHEEVVSEYAAVNLGTTGESNVVGYSVTQKWFSTDNSLSLYGNTQFKVLLEAVARAETSVEFEILLTSTVENRDNFELALQLKSLIEKQTNKKISIHIRDVINIKDTAKFNILVKY